MSNFVTFKVQMLFYFNSSKLIKFNWEPTATPANTARCMWRGRRKAHQPTVAAWRACRAATCGAAKWACVGKRVRSANNVFDLLFLKIILKKG
jgi:hypothetical protein